MLLGLLVMGASGAQQRVGLLSALTAMSAFAVAGFLTYILGLGVIWASIALVVALATVVAGREG